MMGSRARVLYLFDVDGTLTKSRQMITPRMSALLRELRNHVHVGIVSGSNLPKVQEQINALEGENGLSEYDFVFAENGLDAYKGGALIATQNIVNHCGEELLQDLLNFSLKYMSDIRLPKKRGTFVEFRNGMINLCPIGRSCSQLERNEFVVLDEESGIRTKFVSALKDRFPEKFGLEFAIGGEISIDVYPKGWDKTYCLQFLEPENFEAIHFFGDRVLPSGNDHSIFEDARTIGHRVQDPDDTIEQLFAMLPALKK